MRYIISDYNDMVMIGEYVPIDKQYDSRHPVYNVVYHSHWKDIIGRMSYFSSPRYTRDYDSFESFMKDNIELFL
jgi:hypothetical protein